MEGFFDSIFFWGLVELLVGGLVGGGDLGGVQGFVDGAGAGFFEAFYDGEGFEVLVAEHADAAAGALYKGEKAFLVVVAQGGGRDI